jgi:hypothetical protein
VAWSNDFLAKNRTVEGPRRAKDIVNWHLEAKSHEVGILLVEMGALYQRLDLVDAELKKLGGDEEGDEEDEIEVEDVVEADEDEGEDEIIETDD